MGDVTVCVGTFGERSWAELAIARAVPSAAAEVGAQVIHAHRSTLSEARNAALELVRTEWVIFLDADDALESSYVDRMLTGTADVRAPAVSYVRADRPRMPYVPKVAGHEHLCTAECITSGDGNWIVVGACVRTELVRRVGGWRPWPVYEDFDLWMRVLLTGASVEAIPEAIYTAHVNPASRNRAPTMAVKNAVHREIVQSVLGEQAAA